MKIYFVANARMPTEKAHGIHIAKMCEALIENGHSVTLVVPNRAPGSVKEFYGLRVEVPVVRLPTPNLYNHERFGYGVSSACFMLGSLLYFALKRNPLIYTVDMDSFSHTLLPLCGRVIAEMHSPKRAGVLSGFFFKRARIIATNPIIAAELKSTFNIHDVLIEPNGVDGTFFNLERRGTGALYVGRLYKWKGLEILPKAQGLANVPLTVLGGNRAEFERVFGPAENLQFAEVAPQKVSVYMARSAVLLLIGTKKNEESNRYTAPMKVFEYLATGKPVVASTTEALRSLIPREAVVWCVPDSPESLAEAIEKALSNPPDPAAGIALAQDHTWSKRAQRIIQYLNLNQRDGAKPK